MVSKPQILLCGNLVWAHHDAEKMFQDVAELISLDINSRNEFYEELSGSGKYANITGIYRHNISSDKIGIFDKELVMKLPASLKWIAHNGAGYDQIDVDACKERGFIVSNTPGAVDEGTATTALYLLISTARQFSKAERGVRSLSWKAGLQPAHEPAALSLGILGMGGIGKRFAEMAHNAFGMNVFYHSRTRKDTAPSWAEYVADLEKFLARVDVVSVHIALNHETVGFVGEKELRTMKKGSILINTARGKVVDEEALIKVLEEGHLYAAGLDVYPNEPEINPRLFNFPNVTLLPHMGTETQESQHTMEIRALTNLHDFLLKGKGRDIVPEMQEITL